ncbi:hypothetical protein [Aquimarina sp. 2201CG5-10]|uniref:hypothetical protein n=1 Tax=Aquimarina callyspongiae TaxID=3098150 RepID=UPI002AB5BDC0|nr:hypothetical protein [Aquimarina sp. 2201CG5-10]MDY8135447.1 hypothetical protein [Aquimarina sp. 2201CG5-10]
MEFIKILNGPKRNRIQFCVNKGGIMSWKEGNKIYFVTSQAYFVTYHYEEIKTAIKSGLKK